MKSLSLISKIKYAYTIICIILSLPTMAMNPSHSSQSITEQTVEKDPVNLILYENRTQVNYAAVGYMPYYPAYGMIHYNTPSCKIEITGFVDPFALKKNKLIISYKKCRISFDQDGQSLKNPHETEACMIYHVKECNFKALSNLRKINFQSNTE